MVTGSGSYLIVSGSPPAAASDTGVLPLGSVHSTNLCCWIYTTCSSEYSDDTCILSEYTECFNRKVTMKVNRTLTKQKGPGNPMTP